MKLEIFWRVLDVQGRETARYTADSKPHGSRTNESLLWGMRVYQTLFASGYYQVTESMIVRPSFSLTVSQINASLELAIWSLSGSSGTGAQSWALSDRCLCQRQRPCQLFSEGPITGGNSLLSDFQGHSRTCLPWRTLPTPLLRSSPSTAHTHTISTSKGEIKKSI